MTASPFQFTHGSLLKSGERLQNAPTSVDIHIQAFELLRDTDFDYLFPELARDPESLLPVDDTTIENLKNLGKAIIDREEPPELVSLLLARGLGLIWRRQGAATNVS